MDAALTLQKVREAIGARVERAVRERGVASHGGDGVGRRPRRGLEERMNAPATVMVERRIVSVREEALVLGAEDRQISHADVRVGGDGAEEAFEVGVHAVPIVGSSNRSLEYS